MRIYSPKPSQIKVPALSLATLLIPTVANANEGPAWFFYLLMAPFALFATPFFLTIVFVAIAVYCYWQYRTAGNKSLGVVAVLVMLLAIPTAFRDKASFVSERESHQRAEHMAKERREARRAGKHVSPDFKAMSTAYAQKYQLSKKTEADRLNFQAGQEMLRMARTIDAMQQKEPRPQEPGIEKEEAPPVRSGKTLLFELYSSIMLMAVGWVGALVARWRTRRRLTALVHLAPLSICLFMPVIAQLPFMGMSAGGTGGRIYFSWLARLGFTPLPFIVAYLIGILFYHWRARRNGEIPLCQTSAQSEEQEDSRQLESVHQAAADEFVHFTCPGCNLAGRIATGRLPEQGLMATCRKCKTSFPVRRDAAICLSSDAGKPVEDGKNAQQEAMLGEADTEVSARQEEIDLPLGGRQYLGLLAACWSYFLLQILAIVLSWQLGQHFASVPLILTQLLAFALSAPLACICVLATRKSSGIAAQTTGMTFALTTAVAVCAVQVAANGSFPLKSLVMGSALRYALLAFVIALTGVGAGWFFADVERRYGLTPHALFTATFRRLREYSFLIAGWCIFVLIEGLMSPHFHGDAGLILLPIVAVVDNLPFLVVWLLARVASVEEVPSARLAAILFAGFFALLTVPLHSVEMVFSPVGFFFQITPFLGVSVMVCALILLAWIRTRKVIDKPGLLGISSLFPGGRYIYPVRNAILAVAVLAACYGSYNGSRERFDPVHLFITQTYPEIVFTDPGGKPLARLPVGVQTIPSGPISFLSIRANQEGRYTLETDTNGVLRLPAHKPRLATLGIAGLFAGKRHIYLTVLDPRWQVPGSGFSPSYELRAVTTRQTIACKPADIMERLKHGSHLFNLMPLKTWESTVTALENSADSLKNLSPAQLLDIAAPCDRLISTTCDRIDTALLDHPETPELIRKRAIDNFKLFAAVRRSGNYAESILTALEQDAGMSEWMEILRKEIRLEENARKGVATADGRSAATLHEAALQLHLQKKFAEALPLYLAALASDAPRSARYLSNTSYACNDLGMHAWSMRLARQALLVDPRHGRSADAYAQEAFFFCSYEAAKEWAKEAVASGFDPGYEKLRIGVASMETGDRLTAESCLWQPLRLDDMDRKWSLPYLEKIGPRPFWKPVPNLLD